MMGYAKNQLTTEYVFPWYNNVALNSLVRVANPSDSSADVSVYIGNSTTPLGSFTLAAGQATGVSYSGVNSGPLRVVSTNNVPVIASLRVIYNVNGAATSFSEMMGYAKNQLTTEYAFPWYNNVALNTLLRFGFP